jgi:hypothetical protein
MAGADLIALAAQCRAVASGRKIATVVLTADRDFARAAASRVLTLDAATGRLTSSGWLSRLRGL